MADLIKTENGMLYEDDFSSNSLLWQLSPADYSKLEYTENGLKIKRSTDYTTLSIREPERSRYSFFCEIEHHPFNDKDIAGVIVMSNSDQYAECQSLRMEYPSGYNDTENMKDYLLKLIKEYVDSKRVVTFSYNDEEDIDQMYEEAVNDAISSLEDFKDQDYRYIRYDKINGLYSFYASVDGTEWIEVGNTSFLDAGRIGFFYYGSNDEDAINTGNFVIKKMIFYKNKYITINGIKDGCKFSILKDGKEVITSDSWNVQKATQDSYLIDTYTLPVPFSGDIVVSQDDKVICSKSFEDIYGGDIITFSYNYDVFVNNVQVFPEQIFDLGLFTMDTKTFRLDIYNKEEVDLKNVVISVEAYSEYYSGAEPISISIYDESNEIVNFKKELIIDKIPATQGKSILIGLDPNGLQNFYDAAESYRFKLNIG